MKQLLRKNLKKKRKNLSRAWKEKADNKIFQKLQKLPVFQKAKIVFLYISKQDEVDTHGIVEYLGKKKRTIVAPRVKGEHLTLHSVEGFEHLEKGSFEILEPKRNRPKILPRTIQLALVPGIAFDKNGHRVGYGKGYFDRLLKKLPCKKIGLAYGFQIVDKIETHPYDVPVDFIITEKNVHFPASGRP